MIKIKNTKANHCLISFHFTGKLIDEQKSRIREEVDSNFYFCNDESMRGKKRTDPEISSLVFVYLKICKKK